MLALAVGWIYENIPQSTGVLRTSDIRTLPPFAEWSNAITGLSSAEYVVITNYRTKHYYISGTMDKADLESCFSIDSIMKGGGGQPVLGARQHFSESSGMDVNAMGTPDDDWWISGHSKNSGRFLLIYDPQSSRFIADAMMQKGVERRLKQK